MKKAHHFLIATLLFAAPFMIKGQPCSNADDMMQVKGTWKKVSDWISPGSNFQEDMKPAIITRSDQIQRIIQAAYREPKGLQPQWRHEISGVAPLRSRLATYGLTTYLFQYYRHPSKHQLALEDETSIFIEVHVNNFGRYMVYDTSLRVGRYYIALMFPRIGKLKDADVFQISLVRENERFIIVSRNGQLPYTPLTRKTYLTALRKKLQKEETRLMDNAVRYAKNEEARVHEMEYWK